MTLLHSRCLTALLVVFFIQSSAAGAQTLSARQQLARDIYQELVEINTRHGDRRHAARRRSDGGAAAGGGLRRRGRAGALAGAAQGQSGCAIARHGRAQADPAARAHRRGRGTARGLVGRSVQADRAGRLFLRPRHDRRQIHGGGLRRQPDPLQQEGYQPDRDIILVLETDEEILDRNMVGHPLAARGTTAPDRRRVRPQRRRPASG